MQSLINSLYRDEAGFIVSAELVLVATIAVLSLIVGLAEVASGINQELEDVGSAFQSLNQSYHTQSTSGHKGCFTGSCFRDHQDFCAGENDIR